jgi:hypothetical protein
VGLEVGAAGVGVKGTAVALGMREGIGLGGRREGAWVAEGAGVTRPGWQAAITPAIPAVPSIFKNRRRLIEWKGEMNNWRFIIGFYNFSTECARALIRSNTGWSHSP